MITEETAHRLVGVFQANRQAMSDFAEVAYEATNAIITYAETLSKLKQLTQQIKNRNLVKRLAARAVIYGALHS